MKEIKIIETDQRRNLFLVFINCLKASFYFVHMLRHSSFCSKSVLKSFPIAKNYQKQLSKVFHMIFKVLSVKTSSLRKSLSSSPGYMDCINDGIHIELQSHF